MEHSALQADALTQDLGFRRGLLTVAEAAALLPVGIRQTNTLIHQGELRAEEVWVGRKKRLYPTLDSVLKLRARRGLPPPPGIAPPAVPPPEGPVALGHNGERKRELRRRVDEGLDQLRLKLTVLDAVLAEYLVRRFLRSASSALAEHALPVLAACALGAAGALA